jgi:hypothetical protein
MIHDEWRHRAHAADDLLTDIAAVCRGEMPPEPREGGSEAHRAAWIAVCALRADAEQLLAARDEARRMLAECTVLSGADTDGNTVESGWVHLWRRAVDDVSQLRADYDDHSDIERAEREVERLRGEVAAERAAVVAFLRETLATSETAYASDDLDYAIDIIERGEHRREGGE